MKALLLTLACCFTAVSSSTFAFVPHASSPSSAPSRSPSRRQRSPSSSIANAKLSMSSTSIGDMNAPLTIGGEASRAQRRTRFTHDDWVRFRSSDRFRRNLSTIFVSGVYRNVSNEIVAVAGVACLVVLWNTVLVGGYQDFSGVNHPGLLDGLGLMKVGLPLAPFTLLGPSLGLLLTFRANKSYKRWDEARKAWGLNINHTRDLNRMACAWYGNYQTLDDTSFLGEELTDESYPIQVEQYGPTVDPYQREVDLKAVSLNTWAFVRSMKRHLSPPWEDEEDYVAEIRDKLPPDQADNIINAVHRPNSALQYLSASIEALPMHFLRKDQMNDKCMSVFEDTLGGCERLLSSPVPVFYSRHTARFLAGWLLLLPLGMYGVFDSTWNNIGLIPAVSLASLCLFGIEEISTQMEEPFTVLPMQAFCDNIGIWCNEIVSFHLDSVARGGVGVTYEPPSTEYEPTYAPPPVLPEPAVTYAVETAAAITEDLTQLQAVQDAADEARGWAAEADESRRAIDDAAKRVREAADLLMSQIGKR